MLKKQSTRIVALDLMRGYFLLCMLVDHLNFWPNGLDWLSARGQLFVSAAEGFFLISGIVLGMVRGRKLLNQPFSVPAKLLLKRGLQLYVTYVLLALFFTYLGWMFFMHNPGLKDGIAPVTTPVVTLIWKTVTLQYLYGWADYLRLYSLFLFASPLVLWLLRKGKWWVVALASLGLWAFSPNTPYPGSLFVQPYKWQLLFYGGMIVGFYWRQLSAKWQTIRQPYRRMIISTLLTLSALTLAGNLFLAFGGLFSHSLLTIVSPLRSSLHVYFDKELLPLARLAMATAWFCSGYWLFRRFETYITHIAGWILLPFGTHSLYVYTVQAFFLFFVHLIVPSGNTTFLINALLSWGTIALIWIMVRYHILFKIIPR